MLQAILFDLDGTLAHTDPVHYDTWHELLLEFGIELNPELYKQKFNGRLNEDIVRDLLPHLSSKEGYNLSRHKEAAFRKNAAQSLSPMPGLRSLLDWVEQQQLQRAVVTNAPRENAIFTLGLLGLTDIFPVVILGEELERGKPDPLPYQTALQQLNITDPTLALVFEDSPSGVRSAVAAGIPTVGIASSQEPSVLYDAGATLVIPDFTHPDLRSLLQP